MQKEEIDRALREVRDKLQHCRRGARDLDLYPLFHHLTTILDLLDNIIAGEE